MVAATSFPRWSYAVLAGVFLAVLGALVMRGLALNDGLLVYPLDDTYIGMAMAEEIAGGTYGINTGEWSAPASTILWPPMLAPFSRLPGFDWVPLLLNALWALAALALMMDLARDLFRRVAPAGRSASTVAVGLASLTVLNLWGLTLIGMEHGLQVLLAVAVGVGLTRAALGRERSPWVLSGALLLGPLVRYEALALTVPALAVLWSLGERRRVAAVAAATLAPLAAFSLFLLSIGVGPLPTSIVVRKFNQMWDSGLLSPVDGVVTHLGEPAGLRMGLVAVALGLAVLRGAVEPRVRWLVAWALAVAAPWLNARARELRGGRAAVAALLVAAGVVLGWPYLRDLPRHAPAANDIYTQQVQMQRFLVEEWRGAAALNDIGYPSYRNPYYVLDLMGLSSPEVLEARRTRLHDPAWLDDVVEHRGIELVMIFESNLWFPAIPRSWQLVARLRQTRPRATRMGGLVVALYGTTPDAARRIARHTEAFAPRLPEGVELEIDPTFARWRREHGG